MGMGLCLGVLWRSGPVDRLGVSARLSKTLLHSVFPLARFKIWVVRLIPLFARPFTALFNS